MGFNAKTITGYRESHCKIMENLVYQDDMKNVICDCLQTDKANVDRLAKKTEKCTLQSYGGFECVFLREADSCCNFIVGASEG